MSSSLNRFGGFRQGFGRGSPGAGRNRGPSGQINEKRRNASQNKNHHGQQTKNAPIHGSGEVGVGFAEAGCARENGLGRGSQGQRSQQRALSNSLHAFTGN